MRNNTPNTCINRDVSRMIDAIILEFFNLRWLTYQDKEDLRQELVLFFIERCTSFANERELVFVSLRNKAINFVKHASYRHHASLDLLIDDDFEISDTDTLDKMDALEQQLTVRSLFKLLDQTEHNVCQGILDGLTFDEIVNKNHIAKKTIYKAFERIRKKI